MASSFFLYGFPKRGKSLFITTEESQESTPERITEARIVCFPSDIWRKTVISDESMEKETESENLASRKPSPS